MTNLSPGPNSTVTELVSGIVTDAQDLAAQQIALFRSEIRRDVRTAKEAAVNLGIGFVAMQIGGALLCLMLVHALVVVVPSLPLWVSYGIVGAVVVGAGAIPIVMGINKLKNLNPLPDEATQTLKENAKWLLNPKNPK
ncbi:MAG: phage holin family protein [Planctomycetaceae bacterium]|nr:phage holin family protein [Planctomycetaceae bacterium]